MFAAARCRTSSIATVASLRHRPTILICDSETDSDLVAIGRLRRDDDVLFVGSSGLAGALGCDARDGLPALPFLVLVGSLNPASQFRPIA